MTYAEQRKPQFDSLSDETAKDDISLTLIEELYAVLTGLDITKESWRSQAACLGVDPALFFPPKGNTRRHAVEQICNSCPVQSECLEHATSPYNYPVHGYWAGKSARELNRLRRQRIIANRRRKRAGQSPQ